MVAAQAPSRTSCSTCGGGTPLVTSHWWTGGRLGCVLPLVDLFASRDASLVPHPCLTSSENFNAHDKCTRIPCLRTLSYLLLAAGT
jgi:hypothetical protein